MYDLARVADSLAGQLRFTFVGDCPKETAGLRSACRHCIEFVPRQPQSLLGRYYRQADLFLFPTIQDGYGAVLAQAHASGLPILTTENCAGRDLVREGETGWVFPIRSPDAFIRRLRFCDAQRGRIAGMVRDTYLKFRPRDWSEVASDLLHIFHASLKAGHEQRCN
jgi:glycosyltransferase involved in cell wall biosynthesis